MSFLEPKTIPNWETFDAILITSGRAAQWLGERHFTGRLAPLALLGSHSAALLDGFEQLDLKGRPANAAELVVAVKKIFGESGRFLFLKGEHAKDTIPSAFQQSQLTQLTVYTTQKLLKEFPPLDKKGMVYFQAPSTVADFHAVYGRVLGRVSSIGPSTTLALNELGWSIDFQPSRPETAIFVKELPEARLFT